MPINREALSRIWTNALRKGKRQATMAGNILHGSQTSIQLNGGKSSTNLPSIFDFLAQDSLRASLRPGIRAAVKLLAQKFPKLGSIVDRQFDEFFLLFEAMLENHFLKKFCECTPAIHTIFTFHFQTSFSHLFSGFLCRKLLCPQASASQCRRFDETVQTPNALSPRIGDSPLHRK